eukprot:CAMPEP_0119512054 /NCGR_PEP_ID=MMETSP1344-20130328/30529_1 /TAXON_ID=236787 /ORGANISM="Florenciella parvula, Strain CCMP2471" /LENGTH=107 /DNA_ID=CAMNT_0007549123 /DNA_START=306 /DNA_END=625 /DNA_ORIENTATION=-
MNALKPFIALGFRSRAKKPTATNGGTNARKPGDLVFCFLPGVALSKAASLRSDTALLLGALPVFLALRFLPGVAPSEPASASLRSDTALLSGALPAFLALRFLPGAV